MQIIESPLSPGERRKLHAGLNDLLQGLPLDKVAFAGGYMLMMIAQHYGDDGDYIIDLMARLGKESLGRVEGYRN